MLREYEKKTKLRPLIWMRYIDDIFFIWTNGEDTLKDFIKFCDNYSSSKKMKSNIRYESSSSMESVNFLDVKVKLVGNRIQTSLFTKPTDAHLYLNTKSCHPNHVIKNIPKGQLIRARRICSTNQDFDQNAKLMTQFFTSRGYKEKNLQRLVKEVRSMPRNDLLNNEKKEKKQDPHSILVCTWHPSLSKLPSILNNNYNILDNDAKLRTIFTERPTVAFRRKKNLSNILCKNDIRQNDRDCSKGNDKPCKCQVCKLLVKSDSLTNPKNDLSVKKKYGGDCRSTGVIYAIHCKKCQLLYIGHTGDSMRERYGKHKYDIRKRPDNNELAAHCHEGHDVDQDLEIHILDYGIDHMEERKRREDKMICKLQTMGKNGLNELIGPYAKEMYASWTSVLMVN